jgi:hypothetical protein
MADMDRGTVPPVPPQETASPPLPAMGRVVHYVDEDGDAYPAIVRASWTGTHLVDLTAFTEEGTVEVDRVRHSASHADESWHWPERSIAAGKCPCDTDPE